MDFWDKYAGVYDFAELLNRGVYKAMTEKVAKNVPKGAKVLDCAAGTGELSLAAAKKAKSVLCTDYSEGMLKQAIKKANKKHIKNMSFERRDIYSLSDADETYDVVMAGNVLHLLDEPEKAARELYRVTKKGGKIILPCFVLAMSVLGGKSPLLSIYKKFGFDPKSEYTPESYVEMLKSCRLGRIRVKTLKGLMPCVFVMIIK